MRIYEVVKRFGVPSKELVALLKKNGFDVQSHMSILTDEGLSFLEKNFEKKYKEEEKVDGDVQKKKEEKKVLSIPKSDNNKSDIKEEAVDRKKIILEKMTTGSFSEKTGIPATEIILNLLKQGKAFNINQKLPEDLVASLARFYNIEIIIPEKKEKDLLITPKGKQVKKESRFPIIAVVGHVDHGKTTLLDFIRKSRVAAKEKGGITQHLGAYKAMSPHGGLVFIDTPGHETFSKMRARGVKSADIVILVVAADDGVMPQTVEAINYAKRVNAPIIVALNKIDKAAPAQVEAAKNSLAKNNILIEDWGGDIICVPISAKTGEGVDQLLEMVGLQAEMMDLGADPYKTAEGFVLESKLEKGLGPVATIVCHDGTLNIGDYFISESSSGKVNLIINDSGEKVLSAGPSEPVRVSGFNELPDVGDFIKEVSFAEYKKDKSKQKTTISELRSSSKEAINLVLKVDGKSTREALLDALSKLFKKTKRELSIVKAEVGDINEGDVLIAEDTNSLLVGLHVKTENNAVILARQKNININLFFIIYKLLEWFEEYIKSTKKIEFVEKKSGEAVVRKVFNVKNLGVIAGCYVKDGVIPSGGYIYGYRGNKKIGEGKIKSLQSEKRNIKEVKAGYECGIIIDDITDWQVDDRIECFIKVPKTEK